MVLSVSATAGLLIRTPCPTCLGEGLVAELSSGDWQSRWHTRADLIPVVCPTCEDRLKINLFHRLRGKQGQPPEPPFFRAKNDERFTEIRRIRIARLAEMAGFRSDLVPVLAAALKDVDGKIRRHAIATLADLHREDAYSTVLAAARQEVDDDVRRIACAGLEWFGRRPAFREEVLRVLTKIMEDPDNDDFSVRLQAADSLFHLSALPHAEVHVEELRKSGGMSGRARKVALQFGRKDVILLLIRRLAIVPPDRSAPVAEDLRRLTGEKLGDDPVAWYRWFERNRSALPEQKE